MNKRPTKFAPAEASGGSGTLIAGIVGVIVVAVVVIGGIWWIANKKASEKPSGEYRAETVVGETRVELDQDSIVFTPKNAVAGMVAVDVYSDFRCPFCKKMEQASGKEMAAAVRDGRLQVRFHTMHFLDNMIRSDYSQRALAAFRAVAKQGDAQLAWRFQEKVLMEQPPETASAHEWTNDEFADFAGNLGAEAATVQRVRDGAEMDGAAAAAAASERKLRGLTGEVGSPVVIRDGARVGGDLYTSADWLTAMLPPRAG